uniref:Vitellogenin domain-containing protein n=1 Tax=Anopheles atroparvus TaxID=41427 RepID=A0A182J4N7_ANOAO
MEKWKTFSWGIVLLFFLAIPDARCAYRRNPLKHPRICGRPVCPETSTKFRYNVGSMYKFDNYMYVKTALSGSGENISELHVYSVAEVDFHAPCQAILKLYSIEVRERPLMVAEETEVDYGDDYNSLSDSDDTSKGLHVNTELIAEELSRYELRFAFHDGTISEICHEEDEPVWTLNLKRGILSTLQNTMPRFDIDYETTETDVSGICDVSYKTSGRNGTSLLFRKSKDIVSCKRRYKTISFIQTVPYDFRPISVDNSIYKQVACYERHQLVPFSNGLAGAVTETYTKLELIDEESYTVEDQHKDDNDIQRRSSLLYDHTPSSRDSHDNIISSRNLLLELCALGFPNIKRDFPDKFLSFLTTARSLSTNALYQLLTRSDSICENGRNHILESLPYIGSPASVSLMKDHIVSGKVSPALAKEWMRSFAFLTRPNEEVLEAMMELIEHASTIGDQLYFLPATTVVHTFCNVHPEDCAEVESVQQIVHFLESKLLELLGDEADLEQDRSQRASVILLLKSLSNMGVVNKRLTHELRALIENEQKPVEVRVEAVNVFRRHDCHRTKDYFLKVYGTFQLDGEVRIAAYLQAMRCPDYLSVKLIKHVLKTEEVNQVGSFVWSHLTNLADSASPVRVEAQGLLAENDLGKKFRLDVRKFSRNYEQTLFFDEYNFGLTVDSNLIFSTESYLPRTVRLNLTTDLFGESINFLELNIRSEGLEDAFQGIFGPHGSFSAKMVNEQLHKLLKMVRQFVPQRLLDLFEDDPLWSDEAEGTLEDGRKRKRDTQRLPAVIAREAQDEAEQMGYRLKSNFSDPQITISGKIFGNEMFYLTMGKEVLQRDLKWAVFKKLFSGKEVAYTKSGVFLDTSYDVPLSSGLPLSLGIVGASSVDLRMTGAARTFDFWRKVVDVEGKVKPSVTVDLTATMRSDLVHASTAIKVKSNVYSSSAWEMKMKVRGPTQAVLTVSLPQDRNEIFSVRSEMFVLVGSKELRQTGIERRYSNSTCTWPFIDQAIGLKVCANYSLPDVSSGSDVDVPSLILSGPVNFDFSLDKADLTAKVFQLKYSWDARNNQSIGTIVFDTPHSLVPRIFRANITLEAQRKTAIMSFVNGNISHKAVGMYVDTANQHRLEMSLNVNDRKYLALEMGYNRTMARNGRMYHPSFYLSVNNERIAGMGGQVRQTEKNNITQWDYTMVFETKRLRAKAIGYLAISYNMTYMIHNSMEYRFSSSKLEHLVINALAEAIKKDVSTYNVNFDLRSSAYPHFDVALNATYLEGTGRFDFTLLHNNAPDLRNEAYLTTIKVIFAHDNPYRNLIMLVPSPHSDNPVERTTLSFEVMRPRAKLDLKAMIVHENMLKKGLEHSVRLMVRYAPKREVTGVVSFFIPRSQLFWFDGAFNLTVPGFHPFTVQVRIKEKAPKEHSFDFRGIWFSAHALNVSGWYKDRSSIAKTYHHAKLVAYTGPTYREVLGDLRYIRDENNNRLDVRTMYDKRPYGITLYHNQGPENGTTSYAELKWNDGLYWFSALMKSAPIKQLDLELHIDKARDVSMSLRGYSTTLKREVGIEFNWDANRDPTQRITISGELNTPTDRTYDGLFLLSYPNRTFSGTFDLKLIDPRYLANARISWNTTEAIELRLDAGTDDDFLRNMWLLFLLNTPFEGWRYNSLNGGFFFKNNLLRTNLSAHWAEDQNLGLALMGYYMSNETHFNCELETKLHSSIQHVPTAMVHLKHNTDQKRIETICTVNHTVTDEPPQVFSVRSNWQYDADWQYRNVTGSLKLISPFDGYKTGALVAKVSLSASRAVTGAAELQLDDDKYEMLVVGHVRNLVDCMLTANVTSSNENYRNINGRFGISEKDRHLVAEVITPKTALGVEILYAIVSSQNFDIKFHLATPLKDLEKVIVRGKLQSDNVDFRLGMNTILLGCTGVWRKAHLRDFEYSYRIYTPLPKFEESAVIVKVVLNSERSEYVDVELSGKFSEYKLGLKAVSKRKPQLIRQLLPQTASSMVEEDPWSKEEPDGTDGEDEDEYEDEEDEQELLNFIGDIELYTIVLPTIEGTLELTEHRSQYRAIGKVKLPQGDIEIRDRFYLKDLLNMQNNLRLKTPFPVAKEITSDFVMKFSYQATDITVGMNVKFNNRSEWVNTGFQVNYKYQLDEAEVHKHQALVDLMTPMKNLQKVFLNGSLELEDHSYKGNLTAKTMTTDASLALSFESEDQFIDTFMSVWVRAPLMPYYACRVFYKQDFSDTENSMDLGFLVNDGDKYSNFRIDGVWTFSAPNYLYGAGKYQSNFLPINSINTDLLITRSPYPKAYWNVLFADQIGTTEAIRASAERNREMFTIALILPIEAYNNLSIHGRLMQYNSMSNEYFISGQLYRNEFVFQLEGNATIIQDIPYRAELTFQPLGAEGSDGTISYQCGRKGAVTDFNFKVKSGAKLTNLDGSFKLSKMSDWYVKLGTETSEPSLKDIDFLVGIEPQVDERALGKFNLRSPWVQYGIDRADVELMFDVKPISGSVVGRYAIRELTGNASCLWNWALKSNMQFALENRVLRNSVERVFRTGVRYVNPDVENNHNFTFGGDLNLNNIWIFNANASVDFISIRDLSAVMTVLLPKPVGDVHTLAIAMNGNLPFVEPVKSFHLETSYETEESRKRYAYYSEYSFIGDLRTLLRFEWGPDIRKQRVQSKLDVFRNGDRRELTARLRGPWYLEDAFTAYGTYDFIDALYLVSGNVSIPASTKVASANVAFNNLSNMKGDVNCTTPFLNVTWLHGQLEFIETPLESIRYLKGTWPESSAVFDAKATYRSHNLDREQQGTIKIEVPLRTRHYAEVKYGLAQRPAITTGHAEVDYNSQKVLSGQYTSKEESRVGFDKETIDVTLENSFMPVGVHYVHSLKMLDENIRTLDIKRAEVFKLRNQKNFNITGELHVLNKALGREYTVKAIHPNRTVVLTADFEQENNINRKKSKLQLSPTVWIAYDFHLVNRSRDDVESQNFTLTISYPKRNISADGWYAYTDLAFDSDLMLSYSPNRTGTEEDTEPPKQRTVRGAIVWRDLVNSTTGGQKLQVALGHPSFQQDVTLDALYFTNLNHWFSSSLALRYNDDDDHLLEMGFDLNDLRAIVGYRNYSYHLYSRHAVSDLDLGSIGSIGLRPGLYGISSNSHYQRAYLSQMDGHVLGSLNIKQKELLYERITSQSKYRIWTKAAGAYPVYKINGTLLDGTDVDANGFFYLNIDDRMVQMKINMTPDGSENVYMYGIIPDSRSAYFDFWRDYDNAREVDVTYYLKMNHSRLITGHMLWRPQIKSDLQEWAKDYFGRMHLAFLEYTEFWIKHVYLETRDATTSIYEAAHPYVEGLLEDMAGLSVLQNDLEDLHHFLNASYVADDFYIRSAINFTVTVLDELAIKNKITSLPKILTELWQVMGDSGQALGKSIAWLLERLKQSYMKFMDIVGRIFQGDAMRYLSSTLEESLERYDKFVKDIHLQFIKNIQDMWEKCTSMASTFWHRMLQNIEPTIIRLAHYGESLGWFVGNEIFTFLYNKTQELADSPYFNTVTNFTQDLDMLYKDLVTNDVFTNFKKYSSVTYRFMREKYFQLVPFGREFHQVVMELAEEIKQLQKIEYVHFFIQRYEEVRAKVEWLADEFQVERRLHQMWLILRNKLSHIAQTALQAENHYREAKTKFVFDPDHGVMELEQKLPMSWHAFNETPKFEEIPEFKFIGDIQDLFAGSNTTLWTLYNDICPFADPQMWLPPFKSVALMVGSRHYMSFDKRFISMDLREMEQGGTTNDCRYLLAHDYHNRTLTLLLEPSVLPDGRNSRKITLITNDHTLEIDIFDISVKINKKDTTALPALIGKETVVFRESDQLYVSSQSGFLIACSLRYHLCWLELSGWYFGKVAGLLGTMNNEPFDDRTTAAQSFSQSDDQFLNSWAMPGCRAPVATANSTSNYYRASDDLIQLCSTFFQHKLSYLASCFPVVDVTPFYDMCLDLGNHLQVATDGAPSNRGACSAALAYIQACAIEDTLLRVPDSCISCQLLNGTHVPEGSFVPLRDEGVPAAADVVFIVEAKPCNERFVQTKSINLLVDHINRELQVLKINDTRYGVVAFGGPAPFDRAHSVVVGNHVFERHDRLQPFFEHIAIGNGTNEDIFDAIILASKLIFRPGVSKTFILLPCSRCATSRMELDFSSIVQLLIEYDIKLHILADHELSFNKTRVSRLFYGMDSRAAYTKKDVKELVGDEELRKQIRLPKATLGECIALAMETNGSVFGGHKLRQDRANTNNTKKFIKVFAKRIALTAVPNTCQTCECTGHNTGVAYMQCLPCHYPSPFALDDEDMTDEKFLSVIQPGYEWAWDEEDESLMQ